MENEKKSSCFGVRLATLMTAILLVVCMALPAFAYGAYPDGLPTVPINGHYFICRASVNGVDSYKAYPIDGYSWLYYTSTGSGGYRYYFGSSSSGISVPYYAFMSDGYWLDQAAVTSFTLISPIEIVYCTMDVSVSSSYITFIEPPPPPPPDPMQPFNTGLIIVMDWVGTVVSAVVSGPMSGLLILLAVPVAITLLLVAFIVIRRIIWGA